MNWIQKKIVKSISKIKEEKSGLMKKKPLSKKEIKEFKLTKEETQKLIICLSYLREFNLTVKEVLYIITFLENNLKKFRL